MDCICDVGGAGEAESEGEADCLWLAGVGIWNCKILQLFLGAEETITLRDRCRRRVQLYVKKIIVVSGQ